MGAAAWKGLNAMSSDDLLLYLSLGERGEHRRVAALLLCICLERELGAALGRAGENNPGNTYERKLQAAETSTEPHLQRLGVELSALALHRLRNPVAHGAGISSSELQKLEQNLLTSHAGEHGLLGQLAVFKPTK